MLLFAPCGLLRFTTHYSTLFPQSTPSPFKALWAQGEGGCSLTAPAANWKRGWYVKITQYQIVALELQNAVSVCSLLLVFLFTNVLFSSVCHKVFRHTGWVHKYIIFLLIIFFLKLTSCKWLVNYSASRQAKFVFPNISSTREHSFQSLFTLITSALWQKENQFRYIVYAQ